MSNRTPIYEGKAKTLFEGPEPGTIIQYFKDDTTAFNNKKKEQIAGKGVINNRISEYLFTQLDSIGVPTHFIKRLNMREQLVYGCEIIPLEVIVRNYVAGSFAERFKAEEGEPIGGPLIEFCLKDDKLGDPFIAEEHIFAFDLCDPVELEEIRLYTVRINDFLSGLFRGCGIVLADMKLEFGRQYDENGFSQLLLADEISPDNCRLWDVKTGEKMDKDRFRRDLGGVSESYREVAERLGLSTGMNNIELVETETEEPAKKTVRKTPRKPASTRKPKGKK